MAKETLVTFNENVDTYVRGDVVSLDAGELKRVDAYAERWKINNPYQTGAKDVTDTDSRTASADSERRNRPNDTKTAQTAMASQGNVDSTSTDTIKKETATKPEGNGGEQAAMTADAPDTTDREPANNTVNPGGDTSDSEPAKTDEGSAEATVLPEDKGTAAKTKK